ncbi:hypothetical protein SUGI_0868910 [Cryptomeria japonica]|nr:hypothetical protein SUGI_0868910 [Cryptomeria japonica]
MDQKETTHWKKLSGGECSHAEYSANKTTDSRTDKSFQANKSTYRIFSVKQLYTDVTNQGFSCFFDLDLDSLSVAENFPAIIFEAAKKCKVAVLLLSKDLLEPKWTMLELAAFVENPKPKFLPLFFHISPNALKEKNINKKMWKQLGISGETQTKWLEALKAIRSINGIVFRDRDDEVDFREKIVKEIWRILQPSQSYHIPNMQGGERMCQDITNFFNKVLPNKKGLCGIAGHGKTSLCKAFCNLKLTEFEGKVCRLEFSRDFSFESIKITLRLKGQRVLMVLDNITEESIDEVRYYIQADLSENIYVLLSARSIDLLVKHFNIYWQSCMHVPSLEVDEAIAILLERTSVVESTLGAEDKAFVLKCLNRCSFYCESSRRFQPLPLKALDCHLSTKYGSNFSKWVDDIDGYGFQDVFAVLAEAFNAMPPVYCTIFMLLTV